VHKAHKDQQEPQEQLALQEQMVQQGQLALQEQMVQQGQLALQELMVQQVQLGHKDFKGLPEQPELLEQPVKTVHHVGI
jgi:hypothetical protein